MKLHNFWDTVPHAVKVCASILGGLIFLAAVVVGYITSEPGTTLRTTSLYSSAALVFGILAVIWTLCLGFVFKDAQRRGMRPVLWVLVAMFFPHLLGFLLYFVLRQPVATVCTHCGMMGSPQQRFCPACGAEQSRPDPFQAPLTPTPPQAASQ